MYIIFLCNAHIMLDIIRPQSNMLKKLPKMLLEYPKIFTYYALQTSHYAFIMLEYEQH